jgi:hypothetical protein
MLAISNDFDLMLGEPPRGFNSLPPLLNELLGRLVEAIVKTDYGLRRLEKAAFEGLAIRGEGKPVDAEASPLPTTHA